MRLVWSLIYSNLFTATVLTALATTTYFVIPELEFRLNVVVCVFLASWMLYSFHRLYKVDEIGEEHLAERHRWQIRNAAFTKWGMGVSAFLLMLVLPYFKLESLVWLSPAVVVSVGYTIPFIPNGKSFWRIRDIPLVKPVVIAATATYLTLGFPVFDQLGILVIFQRPVLWQMVERFLFLLAVTLPFEMRDVARDAAAGLVTLPARFGLIRTRNLSIVLLSWWFGIVSWLCIGSEQFNKLLPVISILFLSLALTIILLKHTTSEWVYSLIFEGSILIYCMVWVGLMV